MAFIKLNIPVVVKEINLEERPQYYIRPLFLSYPVATNFRYESAIGQFQKEIKNIFKGFALERSNQDQLKWYLYQPEILFKNYKLEFNIGKQFISGYFSAAIFRQGEHTFIHIPTLNYMFMAHPGQDDNIQIKRACKHIIKQYKEEDGNDFDPSLYYSDKKTFHTFVEVNVNIGQGPFKFERSANNWFFAALGGDTAFEGDVEIEKVGYDLNSLYPSELRRAFYQDDIVDKIQKIVFQADHTPIALIGPEGVGKHTLIHEVIWRYQDKNKRKSKGRIQRLWHIDPTRIISGMSVVGMWQKRFEAILKFIRKPHPTEEGADMLMIDNAVAMLRIGKSAQNDLTLSDVLRPYLEKRQIQFIIIASSEEWKVLQEKDRRFSDLFQIFRIQEPDIEIATRIILQQRKVLESANGTFFTIQAINQLLTIQRNYLKSKPLPGSVMRLMQQLAVKYRFRKIDAPEVRREFETYSGLEERIFDASYIFEQDEVHQAISRQLVGQEEAVQVLGDLIHLVKAKINDKSKPLGSFLFIGPTGVGKTQAAKVLCQYLMGNEDRLLRFDMNEYIDAFAINRLIGDYSSPEGQLTGKVRYRPFSIVLLDEIEKAHSSIHDLLLQVLDDGRLTDALGRTVDFTNTIIIMTSNVGASQASTTIGPYKDDVKDNVYAKAVENHFRPEFINRIDQIVVFNALKEEHILGIARLQIKELLKRDGFVRRTTILNISQAALAYVARRGYDKQMGGRALKRQIEKDLTALSAEQLISTDTETPIIFEILLKNNTLVPSINPLDFVTPISGKWLPETPEELKGRNFYMQLIQAIERLESRTRKLEVDKEGPIYSGSAQENWQYYDFKNKLAELKEHLTKIMLGYRERFFREPPAIPLRLKRGELVQRNDFSTKGVRENLRDRLFQEEGIKELSEAYHFAAPIFDSLSTEFLENYLRVTFIQLAAIDFLRSETQKIELHLTSCINGLGDDQILFLRKLYLDFFERMDISYEVRETNPNIIWAEGHSLNTLLQGEVGIHLFYESHQNPLPIKLNIFSSQDTVKQSSTKVIRVYDGNKSLTDLRTGFSNAVGITPDEFKLLVYAGLDPKVREQINPF
ncbi:MAG: AAA family ATPase [Saprospiraceae bacterium]|nr:AAA family ATPase [Saprospiraceae bacterium]